MSQVLMIRHGPTAWNEVGRIQGHTDVPLSDAGRAEVRSWRLPAAFAAALPVTSPLARARETASLLGLEEPALEPRLMEMNWGRFEGSTLAELRVTHGPDFAELEDRGLDFQPPEGERPAQVVDRLRRLLHELAARPADHVLITHKGVMRAALVLATGWQMLGKQPLVPARHEGLSFALAVDGEPSVPHLVDLRA